MMRKRYKYDVAFSVAAEDLEIAEKVAVSLRLRNISYYLFTDADDEAWGQHLLPISIDKYAREAKYILMIISKVFVEKYWTSIENQVTQAFRSRKGDVLPLRLDDTSVDGLSQFTIFVRWNNNPEEIACKLEKKLKAEKKKKRKKLIIQFFVSLAVIFLLAQLYPFILKYTSTKKISHEMNVDTVKRINPVIKPPPEQRVVKRALVIRGEIRDATTNELMDAVVVHVNGNKAVTKDGTFSVVLPGTEVRERDLVVEYDFSKSGYEIKNYRETIFLSNKMDIHMTSVNLNKLK